MGRLKMERGALVYKKSVIVCTTTLWVFLFLVFYISNIIVVLKRFYQKQLLLQKYNYTEKLMLQTILLER